MRNAKLSIFSHSRRTHSLTRTIDRPNDRQTKLTHSEKNKLLLLPPLVRNKIYIFILFLFQYYILCYYLINLILREPERSSNPLRLNDQTGQSDQTILWVWTIVGFIVLILTFLIIYLPHDYTKFFALRKLAINATARTENLPPQSVFPLPLNYSYFLRTSRLHFYSTV